MVGIQYCDVLIIAQKAGNLILSKYERHGCFAKGIIMRATVLLCLLLVLTSVVNAQDCLQYIEYYPSEAPYLATIDTPGSAKGVARRADHLFVADYTGGIQVIDVSDPFSPIIVGSAEGQYLFDIEVVGDLAFALDWRTFKVFDISNPIAPQLIGAVGGLGDTVSLHVESSIVYIASHTAGLRVVDVSVPTSPNLIATVSLGGNVAMSVDVESGIAFVTDQEYGLHCFDISNPSSPQHVGGIGTPGLAQCVDVVEGLAYIADTITGLVVIDVHDPSNLNILSSVEFPDYAKSVTVENNYAYVLAGDAGLQIVDVSEPSMPEIVGWVDTPYAAGTSMAVSNEYLYYPQQSSGVSIAWKQCGEITVSPDGLGDFSTIQDAIDSISISGAILLENGIYSGLGNRDLDFHGLSITLTSASGNPDSCVIDCQGTESEPHRGFLFQSGETSEAVIEGITIMGGYADEGGAIKCENGSSPTIRNCILRDNYAASGGALHCSESSDPQIEFTVMHFNDAETGGAIFSESSAPAFTNCTISYNEASLAGVAFLLYSTPSFDNCILSHSIEGSAVFCVESTPALYCTDVVWNEGGDWVGCIAGQQNQNGNFSNTPAFCDPESGDLRLQPGSPCLPEHNSCGVLVGALGEGDCSPTGLDDVPSTARVALSAFPNPFNPHLTITFSLPADAQGSLLVHDVSGRQVRVLKDGQFTQGANEIGWNGQDDHGQDVASGVYFVQLVTEEHQESKKVVLLR